MGQQILIVLPFCTNDGVLAERLCDFIFLANKRVQNGHCLLVASGEIHAEQREKVKVAAEVAFESVELITAQAMVNPNKNAHVTRMFSTAAEHIEKSYRLPWLWLEPDCVPVKADWQERLADSYYSQPKRYHGPFMKLAKGEIVMSKVGMYPPGAYHDLRANLNGALPFNVMGESVIMPKASKTWLIQEVAIVDENSKFNETAVVVHHDKNGILMAKFRDSFEQAAQKKRK